MVKMTVQELLNIAQQSILCEVVKLPIIKMVNECQFVTNRKDEQKMKKRWIAIVLCVLTVFALTGCNKTPDETQTEPDEDVVLRWLPAYLDPEVVSKYVNEFNATHDKIQVVASEATYGSVAEYTSSLAMSIAGGDSSYDLFSMSAADFNKYVSSGVAYCLDSHLKDNKDIKSYALDLVTRDGHVYGYPATNDTIGVYVNLDMLTASGHTVDDLKTWDGRGRNSCVAIYCENSLHHGSSRCIIKETMHDTIKTKSKGDAR